MKQLVDAPPADKATPKLAKAAKQAKLATAGQGNEAAPTTSVAAGAGAAQQEDTKLAKAAKGTDAVAAEPKKAEPKKAEPKKAEPKKAEPKKAAAKRRSSDKRRSSSTSSASSRASSRGKRLRQSAEEPTRKSCMQRCLKRAHVYKHCSDEIMRTCDMSAATTLVNVAIVP